MVKYISAEQTLPLRSLVLRNGLPEAECVFPQDHIDGGLHLGCFAGDQLVSVATIFPEDHPEHGPRGFRLRGMASDPAFAGKGYGAKLINFAIDELTSANAAYIWCNARSAAAAFYTKLGFTMISEEFEIPGIGPHFNMIRLLAVN
ncbi:GNAT family N-acetyltransferase [Pedobacter sp. FW305-3-2-15-E-R2A2]|jgi:predicted GNAT family N-acyltransferase|uniref:GNAT family N-acetyltransferase n=1 Tax=Pedobacter sp. FW305-3-2-15-E-R2A2 TaxID=3140251 RepID=UPI003140A6BB